MNSLTLDELQKLLDKTRFSIMQYDDCYDDDMEFLYNRMIHNLKITKEEIEILIETLEGV